MNLSQRILNRKNRSTSDFPSFKTQNYGCSNFVINCSVVSKFEMLEKDTDSFYFALAEKEMEDDIQLELKAIASQGLQWYFHRLFSSKFLHPKLLGKTQKRTWQTRAWFFRGSFHMYGVSIFMYQDVCCYDITLKITKLNSKDENENFSEQNGNGPPEVYRRFTDKKIIHRQRTEVSAQTFTLFLHMIKF